MHHAYVIEAELEAGIERALGWVEENLGLPIQGNPDIILLQHSFFSVDDARRVIELASSTPTAGAHKALVIAASRLYHESQNALLKLFEEPPAGTHLFLVVPSVGQLLSTLRSRVQVLQGDSQQKVEIPEIAREFIQASGEKRAAMIKKLASGKDEDERRENRDTALAILKGIEWAAYGNKKRDYDLLSDTLTLRGYFHERSAPVKQILEHAAIVSPRDLLQ